MLLRMSDRIFGAKHSGDRAHFSDAQSYDFALVAVYNLDSNAL